MRRPSAVARRKAGLDANPKQGLDANLRTRADADITSHRMRPTGTQACKCVEHMADAALVLAVFQILLLVVFHIHLLVVFQYWWSFRIESLFLVYTNELPAHSFSVVPCASLHIWPSRRCESTGVVYNLAVDPKTVEVVQLGRNSALIPA